MHRHVFIGLWLILTPVAATAATAQEYLPISIAESAREGDPMTLFMTGRYQLIEASNSGDQARLQEGLADIAAAARAGFAPAARFAGSLLLEGKVVPRNPQLAVGWYERAAKLGDPMAQAIVGDLYRNGKLVPANPGRAAVWYERVNGNPEAPEDPKVRWEAVSQLAALYANPNLSLYNPERAYSLWHQAATEGNYPPARRALAYATEIGIGTKADPKAALALYFDAAMAYHTGGIRYGIAPVDYQKAEDDILSAMQAIDHSSRLTRKLQQHVSSEQGVARAGTIPQLQ
ncbi:MAG: sel1 repeat family protein [Nitrospirota bacterium]|nr:sel1 repeat family protein [Nitrospirota bacterium]